MLKNNIRIAIRNLRKYKAFSFINIIGLAVGVACVVLILLYVLDDLSYENFNRNAGRIYRVYSSARIEGGEMKMAVTPPPLGATLVREIPEVKQYTRVMPTANMLIRYKNNVFNETRFFWADSTLFDVFTMSFIKGNPRTALNEPHTVILTESLAKKYFGNEDPIDQVMNFEDGTPYTVKGVIKDCPVNSHFHYDMFASMASIDVSKANFWLNDIFYTYIVLKKGASPTVLEAKFPELIKKYAGPQLYQALGITMDDWRKKGYAYGMHLQSLNSIHLYSHLENEMEPNSDIKYVYIFSVIAIFILLIACINFMNLATARSVMRSKEVGVRKVLGSNRAQLIIQFLLESIMLTFFSIMLAIVLVEICLPYFSDLSGKQLHSAYFNNLFTIPSLILTVLIVGIIAGSYPAFFLSSFRPVKVLKGKAIAEKGSWFRSGLVVFQFSISIILFIGTFIIDNQLNYIQKAKLGFNKEQVLVVKRAWALENHAQTFKEALLKNHNIINASCTNDLPGQIYSQTLFKPENASSSQQYLLATMFSDYDFIKTLDIKLASGRYFSKKYPSDSLAVVLNQKAVQMLDIKDPIGKRLSFSGSNISYQIIGIVKDFNFESLHQSIRPLVLLLNRGQSSYMPIKISSKNISESVSFIKNEWKRFVPNKPFEYFFLDDEFSKLYLSEQKTSEIFTAFSVLAIFIASLGLFGLAAFTAERRTKEIGIRKALGASISNIILLLSKEFTKCVLIANVIAWPVAYYFMNNWLKDFAYRIHISLWTFILAGCLALIIALLTVTLHAIKAAMANPIKSLRYE